MNHFKFKKGMKLIELAIMENHYEFDKVESEIKKLKLATDVDLYLSEDRYPHDQFYILGELIDSNEILEGYQWLIDNYVLSHHVRQLIGNRKKYQLIKLSYNKDTNDVFVYDLGPIVVANDVEDMMKYLYYAYQRDNEFDYHISKTSILVDCKFNIAEKNKTYGGPRGFIYSNSIDSISRPFVLVNCAIDTNAGVYVYESKKYDNKSLPLNVLNFFDSKISKHANIEVRSGLNVQAGIYMDECIIDSDIKCNSGYLSVDKSTIVGGWIKCNRLVVCDSNIILNRGYISETYNPIENEGFSSSPMESSTIKIYRSNILDDVKIAMNVFKYYSNAIDLEITNSLIGGYSNIEINPSNFEDAVNGLSFDKRLNSDYPFDKSGEFRKTFSIRDRIILLNSAERWKGPNSYVNPRQDGFVVNLITIDNKEPWFEILKQDDILKAKKDYIEQLIDNAMSVHFKKQENIEWDSVSRFEEAPVKFDNDESRPEDDVDLSPLLNIKFDTIDDLIESSSELQKHISDMDESDSDSDYPYSNFVYMDDSSILYMDHFSECQPKNFDGPEQYKFYTERRKKFKQYKAEHGFDPSECWNLDVTFAEFIWPRLVKFKEDVHTHPGSLESMEEWHKILDKMIKTFKIMANSIDNDDYDRDEVEEGLQLFAKYYLSLWT